MEKKTYIVEGRQFRTEADYKKAIRDQQTIERLRGQTDFDSRRELEHLFRELQEKKYRFYTLLGEDFLEEVQECLEKKDAGVSADGKAAAGLKKTIIKDKNKTSAVKGANTKKTAKKANAAKANIAKANTSKGSAVKGTAIKGAFSKKNAASGKAAAAAVPDKIVQEELKRQEKRRRLLVILCSLAAACCLGYFAVYSYFDYKTGRNYDQLSSLKEKPPILLGTDSPPVIHYTEEGKEPPPVLDEYKNLVNKNKRVIGWLKIDDTNIDYPVMQTADNEYYLDHNLNQEYDKNGSIFMDKDCDVLKPSTNFILYGHHMKSGKMFGKLDLYSSEEYYKKHRYIQFDTIYEKGTYEVMYTFRSQIYKEEDIVFKYYQFIDALSEQEFDSYMEEMAELSFYDTGVTARFGDQLLTLSTCDYFVKDGRFVVVAKRIS